MNTYNAWEIDAEAKRILEAVGIPESMLGTLVSKVCGGAKELRGVSRGRRLCPRCVEG